MVFAIAAILGLQTVDLPKTPVTCHLLAMSVPQALSLISKKASVELTSDESLNNDVVVIRSQGAPLADLGHQLALSLDADWESSGKGFALSRSSDSTKAEAAAQLAFDAQGFQITQDQLKAEDKKLPEWNLQTAKHLVQQILDSESKTPPDPVLQHQLEIQVPVVKLFNRVVASISATELAQIRPWGRVVYTVRPNPAQRPIPSDGAGALIAFLDEQDTWQDAAAPFANLNLSPALSSARPFRADPKKVYLAISRDDGTTLHTEFRVVDSGGGDLTRLNGQITPADQPTTLPELQEPTKPLILFPASVVKARAIKANLDLRALGAAEAPLRAQAVNPETTDPLASLPGEVIDAAAQGIAANLVAVLPDEAISLYHSLDAAHVQRADVWKALGTLGMEAKKDGDWLRLRPVRMAAEHEQRVDRAILGNLMRAAPDGPAHLETIAALAITPGGSTKSAFLMDTLQFWSKPLYQQVLNTDWISLRVFGFLADKERQTLQAGAVVNILELSPQAQEAARELIDRGLFATPPSNKRGGQFIAADRLEPTDMLPEGIPSGATIGGSFVVTPIASVPPAGTRLPSDDDKRIPPGNVIATLKAGEPVEFGMSYLLNMKVHMYPSLYAGGVIEEVLYMGVAKTEADLPEPYKTAIARYRKE